LTIFHLRQTLRKRNIGAFVASEDIPKTIQNLSDEWRAQIDAAIASCNIFILVLSGPQLTIEMTREVALALKRKENDANLTLMICHYHKIPRTSKEILSKTGLDTAHFQQIDFTDKVDLARNVNLEIDADGAPMKHAAPPGTESGDFERRLEEILTPSGKELGPIAQILVGPVTKVDDYLKPTKENARLFTSFTPSFLIIDYNRTTPRRDRYQFTSYEKAIHFEVYIDGYLHARFPLPLENNTVWLGNIIYRVSSFLFYTVRLLKQRKVAAQQKMHIELSGFQDVEVLPSRSPFRLGRYYFPADRDKSIFEKKFDPSADWKTTFNVACAIYREILLELGIADVPEEDMRNALRALVMDDMDLKTEYSIPPEKIPRVDLKDLVG
jgi:hypothetical protein